MRKYVEFVVSRSPIIDKEGISSRINEILTKYGAREKLDIDPVFLSQLIARAVSVDGQGELEALSTVPMAPPHPTRSSELTEDIGDSFDIEERRQELREMNMPYLRSLGGKATKKADLIESVLEIERKRSTLIPALCVKGGVQRDAFWKMSEFDYSAYADDVRKAELRGRPAIEEGAFTCKRCRSQRTVMRSKYGASGDEAVPVVVICLGCGNTW